MSGTESPPSTRQKALAINLATELYGTFSEIGAGQEVARWFFKVGGASGTIAKTMSAYDMTISDVIYGKTQRYVSQRRLEKMLHREFDLLVKRLTPERGSSTRFFSFADTVKAKSYSVESDSHGWMGISFQHKPKARPSVIIIHLRMLNQENIQQQEALGIIGVNLVYGAMLLFEQPEKLIHSLMDALSPGRIEVDMIRFNGPAFRGVDNRLMSLQLVQQGLADATIFKANGEVVQPSEILRKRAVLVERGSFRPVTKVSVDMLKCALAQFNREYNMKGEKPLVILEMTLQNLNEKGKIDYQDFLDRTDLLGTLGNPVLISNYDTHYRLASFLFRHTHKPIGLVMGVPTLREVFDEKYYTHLKGGILESFGRLFKNDLKLFIYPLLEKGKKEPVTMDHLQVLPHLQHLFAYLRENRNILGIEGYARAYLSIFSRDALAHIKKGKLGWEKNLPSLVAEMIKKKKLFGYKRQSIKNR